MDLPIWDGGKDAADHAVATNVRVYFGHPHSPWERGSNENTSGLLRQYFPKGTELSLPCQRDSNRVARELNTRPRKTPSFHTPAATLTAAVALTR